MGACSGVFALMKTILLLFYCAVSFATAAEVPILQLGANAMQPRTVAGPGNNASLVYLDGKPAACEVMVATIREAGTLDNVRRVSTPESQAGATGTVRGPTLAMGVGGVRHVLWSGTNGSAAAGKGSALFYSRLDAYFNASKPQDMMGKTVALDGGAAVASDGKGKVWIVWHAGMNEGGGEAQRRVFIRQSNDDGLTFGEPWTPKGEAFGVCACCGVAAAANAGGALAIWYRTAIASNGRGARLIELPAGATAATPSKLLAQDDWQMPTCPMTTAECRESNNGMTVQWVRAFQLETWAGATTAAASKQTTAVMNHPRSVFNAQGEELRTWVEGSGWNKAGVMHWQVFAKDGSPSSLAGNSKGKLWSYAAPFLTADGRWGIVF